MRGCSGIHDGTQSVIAVFPAYAGMFRITDFHKGKLESFPRVCGDVPTFAVKHFICYGFSPRMRGCSPPRDLRDTRLNRFPRVCGDVPFSVNWFIGFNEFSPRMRGCSVSTVNDNGVTFVFPAYAGMFLDFKIMANPRYGFPRVCGDVPGKPQCRARELKFSPRMRGCSYCTVVRRHELCVFPAYAGMFRGGGKSFQLSTRFPRVCGDVPAL